MMNSSDVLIPISEYKRLLKIEEQMRLLTAAITDDIRKNGDCYHVYSNGMLRLLTGTTGIVKEEGHE